MKHHPLIFGHRGASRLAPENTLPAFEKAIEVGADGVELDVRYSADGRLVVMHNPDLEHTTNGHGQVAGRTLAELRALDAGAWFGPAYAATRVPTLDEALDLMAGRGLVNIELKSAQLRAGGMARDVVAAVRAHKMADQVILSSFNPFALRPCKALAPEIATGYLTAPDLPRWLRSHTARAWSRADGLHPSFEMVDEEYVALARRRGMPVRVWTVDEEADARRMIDLGVDAIITDVPERVARMVEAVLP